jgi:hypothetical protein
MLLSASTLFHVVLSLVGIGSGLVVLYGLLGSKRFDGWTTIFLTTTFETSVTGLPPFAATQVVVLAIFVTLAVVAIVKFHAAPIRAAHAQAGR